jgi:4-hydroxy-tetrahydrodipicolinate synthase
MMNRDYVDWKGYWVATPTPFTREGALDENAFRESLRLYHCEGVHGVLVNGTTGEWFSQSDAERRRVAEIAVEELKGKMPVVIGCTTFTPSHSIELGRHAHEIGADGMMSTPPPYAAPTAREIVAFYKAISDKVELPVMVYNWARGTHVEITWDIAAELAQIDRVVSLKDSTTNRVQAIRTLEEVGDKLRIFSGFISTLGLALLRGMGGDGNIDGGGLAAPFGVAFYEAVWRNDDAAAKRAIYSYGNVLGPIINPDWSARFGSPQAQLKAAMNILGQPGGYPRPPLLPVDDKESLAALREILSNAGLLSKAAA